jgi:Arc/MetJ family transcription regulator
MGAVDRKQALFENIERLRRVERDIPPNLDLVAVRAALEAELGETVSRRLAARLLGVSHTALDRWVDAGDIPVVFTPAGQRAVPVDVLLDLRESVAAEPRTGGGLNPRPLKPVMARSRERAKRLDVDALLPPGSASEGHDRAARRNLAYHRAVARSLDRKIVDAALRQMWKWRLQGRIDVHYAERWEGVLRGSVADVRKAIAEDSQDMGDLRQNSPFAGMLSEPERREIFQHVR